MEFPFYKQLNAMDCGPTCLRMISKSYGKHYNSDTLRNKMGFGKTGVSLLGLSKTAEEIGFRTRGVKVSFDVLKQLVFPCILHWDQSHFVVLIEIKRKSIKIADPGRAIISYSKSEFLNHWISTQNTEEEQLGVALMLEPTPIFYENNDEKEHKLSWRLVFQYLVQSRWQITQILIALLLTSLIQLIFPFLTQSIVDTGINTRNLQFIVIILIAQLMLSFSQTMVSFIRSKLLLKVSNILNIQILSDFWIKLTKLPLSYFDIHQTGDTLQRLSDHNQIQNFLTGPALNTLFSVFNFVVYSIVLILYNVELFIIFIVGSILYFSWIQLFLRIRRKLNYETFHLSAKENNATLQLVQGMQEIRLNNAEKQKRWDWENIQALVCKLSIKSLNYSQWQSAGATLINQIQNISISFIVANLVIEGKLTLGAMLSVQYILGQLSGPIGQWVGFVQSAQDAKIGMERLNEIHQLEDEESIDRNYINEIPTNKSITINDLNFSYPDSTEQVLKNINLYIPEGKVTAIVGSSGSGKTTLIKILLKVYTNYEGEIRIGRSTNFNELSSGSQGLNFKNISHSYWRLNCGSVLQDGYIFNDTIVKNIAVGQEDIEPAKLTNSCKLANIYSFIESLPNGFYTRLGSEGIGLSQGQRQRLLIARAAYKNPQFIFFDEATNSLDANNERSIVENLNSFYKNRTVIIAAHRLSTIRNADKIVVIENGSIAEEGNHEELITKKGNYYQLIKNQLELGD